MCHSTIVREAWDRGQELAVHAWIYGLKDGHITDLGLDVRGHEQLPGAYAGVLSNLSERWSAAA